MDLILQKFVEWAEREPSISSLILEGSRGGSGIPDEFSDYDLNVYIRGENKFMLEDDWMETFGRVLIYQKEKFNFQDIPIHTRLILFENLPRIDFSFWPVHLLEEVIVKRLPESYKNGYQVLVDKEGLCRQLPSPSGDGFRLVKPGPVEFLETVYNFWFEILTSLKYISRGSMWFAKTILDGPARKFMFKMILWKEGCDQGWGPNDLHLGGKNLEMKAGKITMEKIPGCFSNYSLRETVQSLLQMIALFKILSMDVSVALSYTLPEEKIFRFEKYILRRINRKKQKQYKSGHFNFPDSFLDRG